MIILVKENPQLTETLRYNNQRTQENYFIQFIADPNLFRYKLPKNQ